MNIGIKIQELRTKSGISQEILAEKLGVTRQSVSKWELGQAVPDIDKIIDMSKLFRITTDELLLVNANSYLKPNKNILHFGSVYLIVKDFQKSIDFTKNFSRCVSRQSTQMCSPSFISTIKTYHL